MQLIIIINKDSNDHWIIMTFWLTRLVSRQGTFSIVQFLFQKQRQIITIIIFANRSSHTCMHACIIFDGPLGKSLLGEEQIIMAIIDIIFVIGETKQISLSLLYSLYLLLSFGLSFSVIMVYYLAEYFWRVNRISIQREREHKRNRRGERERVCV